MRAVIHSFLACVLAFSLLLTGVIPVAADAQVHTVQRGETLSIIAQKYNLSVSAIMSANALRTDRIYAGQKLVIPDPNAIQVAPGGEHIVQAGDTLFRIGLKYGVSWVVIKEANNLASTVVYPGQRLIIPGVAGSPEVAPPPEATSPPPAEATPAPTPAPSGEAVVHIVQAGETLHKIGLKYGVTWPEIQTANQLASEKIYVGQRLIIPVPGSAVPPPPGPAPEPGAPPAGDGKRFLVDLSDQRYYAYEGDTLVRSSLISSGTWRYPTVVGTFYIYMKFVSSRMKGPDYDLPNVPYSMYFYKGYALHGTYWHSNFGTPMSHGCVNMPTAEAEWAYNWSEIGTPVIVQP